MGELVFAAKVTHVPSMFISEMEGPLKGCRQGAIDGLRQIGDRIKAEHADTVVVLDSHWLVNAGYHINACDSFHGLFTSNEFPHFINNLEYSYRGNGDLGDAIAAEATRRGVRTRSHHIDTLDVEYGTLVPLRFMGAEASLRVVPIAGWLAFGNMPESRIVGEAIATAIANSDSRVILTACLPSLIHCSAVPRLL